MFPPVANGGQSQDGSGMFPDPLTGQGSQAGAGQGQGQQGQPPVDPDEPKPIAGMSEKDLYEKRKAYWQSKVDKATAHNKQLTQALEAERDAIALGRLAMKNPAVLQNLTALTAPPQVQEEKPPEPPVRPDSFNETEAYSNPESESWKYRKKEEQFQRDKIAFLERRDAKRDEALRKMQEEGQARSEAQARQVQVAQLLVAEHGFKQNELPAFFQMMDENPTLEDLVTVFRVRQRRQQGGPQQDQHRGGPTPPPPPVIRQGAPQSQPTVNSAFSQSLIGATRGR